MLDEGALIAFTDPETGERLKGVVQSCNRRGTVCTVELSNEEVQRINLSNVEHQVLGKSDIAALEDEQEDGQESDKPLENGHTEEELNTRQSDDSLDEAEDDDEMEGEDDLNRDELDDQGEQEGDDAEKNEEDSSLNDDDDEDEDHDDDEEDENEDDEGTQLHTLDIFDASLGKAIEDLTTALEQTTGPQNDSEELTNLSKRTLQALYALAKETTDLASTSGLPELYVDGFDSEQIWGQLDVNVQPALKKSRKQIKRLQNCERLLDKDTEADLDELLKTYAQDATERVPQDDSDDELMDEIENEEDSDKIQTDRGTKRSARKRKQAKDDVREPDNRVKLPTEDDFFKLSDMERFVQDAEQVAADRPDDENDQEEDDDASEPDEPEADSDVEGLDLEAIHGLGQNGQDESSESESASDEEDAELARMLESYSGKSGKIGSKKISSKKRRVQENGDDDEDPDAIFYNDFFGSGPSSRQDLDAELPGEEFRSTKRKQAAVTDLQDLMNNDDDDENDDDGDENIANDDDVDNEDEDEDEEGIEAEARLNGQEEDDDSDGQERLLSTLRGLIDQKKAEEAKQGKYMEDMTAHERRQLKIADRARKLEEENMGEKDWHMRGEMRGDKRPLNSALEVDLDFERALKPPPQPTEEFTATLEDLIKQRIADVQFDDPIRRAPPTEELNKELAEMDDKKASKGLGEEYADDYIKAKTGNAVEDKDESTRSECRVLLKSLFAKLDALSHFHFAPKPIIKEMSVQKEVPALAMEEIAPQVVSEAARQMPEEVYRLDPKISRKEDREHGQKSRNTQRTSMKRAMKKRKANEAEEQLLHGETNDNIIGRKSAKHDDEALAASKKEKKKQKRSRTRTEEGPKIRYNKSATVFGKLQDAKDGLGSKILEKTTSSKALKL